VSWKISLLSAEHTEEALSYQHSSFTVGESFAVIVLFLVPFLVIVVAVVVLRLLFRLLRFYSHSRRSSYF
jgi:Flp pilus assembly protein TadB